VRVVSRHQVLEQTIDGKAWLVIGNMDISPDQQEAETVDCTVLNLKNGEMFSPSPSLQTFNPLTKREAEILRLIQKGLLRNSRQTVCQHSYRQYSPTESITEIRSTKFH